MPYRGGGPLCFEVCVPMWYNEVRCVIQFLQAEASCGEVCVTIDRRVQTANDKLFQARKFFQNSREIFHFWLFPYHMLLHRHLDSFLHDP